jgi:hypothetical protein
MTCRFRGSATELRYGGGPPHGLDLTFLVCPGGYDFRRIAPGRSFAGRSLLLFGSELECVGNTREWVPFTLQRSPTGGTGPFSPPSDLRCSARIRRHEDTGRTPIE